MNDPETPELTLEKSIEVLKSREEFQMIVQFLRDTREEYFEHFADAPDPNTVMKHAGGIAAVDYILGTIEQNPAVVQKQLRLGQSFSQSH